MSLCVKFTSIYGLCGAGLAMHNERSEAVILVQFVAVTAGLVEEEHLGLYAVVHARLCNCFLMGKWCCRQGVLGGRSTR